MSGNSNRNKLVSRYLLRGVNMAKTIIGLALVFTIIFILNRNGLFRDPSEAGSNLFIFYLLSIMSYIVFREFRFKTVASGLILLSLSFFLDALDELIFFPDDSLVDVIEDFCDDYIVALSVVLMFIGYKIVLSHKENSIVTLKHKSLHDDLTGIYNRAALFHLYGGTGISGSLTFCYIDLDGFKGINDTEGHDAGDFVLKTFAETVNAVKREDDRFFRIGGDEFILVIGSHDPDQVSKIIHRLRTLTREVLSEYSFDFSCGRVALKHTMTLEEIIMKADEAMYREKRKKQQRSLAKS